MPIFSLMDRVETGSKRYVDGLLYPEFKSGHFYASQAGSPTGPVIVQITIDSSPGNENSPYNARRDVYQFV